MTVSEKMPNEPKIVADWLQKNFKGRLPVARWKALADVICSSADGRVESWGFAVQWTVNKTDAEAEIIFEV